MTSTQTLSEAGQKLADALIETDLIEQAEAEMWAEGYNTAAALLLTAPEGEGAGLREAMKPVLRERDRWADSRFAYPDSRHVYFTLGEVRSLALAYEAATLAPRADPKTPDAGVGGSVGGGGLREVATGLIAFWKRIGNGQHEKLDGLVRMAEAALASPQPAVQGPVAAGVGVSEVRRPPTWHTDEFDADIGHCERLLAKLLGVSSYEHGDGSEDFDNDATMTLVNILAAAGLYDKDENRPILASTTPPADPKTPDAGVGLWCMHVAGSDDIYAAPDFWTALAWAAELNGAIAERAIAGKWAADDNWPLTQATVQPWPGTGEDHGWRLAKELADRAAHEARRAALAQPAPVGEDETGVREALVEAAGVLEVAARFYDRDSSIESGLRRDRLELAASRARAALAPQPPKAETTAGVGEASQNGFVARNCACCADQPTIPPDCPACHGAGGFTRYYLTAHQPVPEVRVADAGDKSASELTRELRDIIISDVRAASGSGAFPGEPVGLSASHLSVILAARLGCHFAALSTAPAARPGDGVEADKDRLDWLEKAARKSRSGISFDHIPSVEGERSGFRFMRKFFIGDARDTLRSAIDAARGEVEQMQRRELVAAPAADGGRG